MSLITLSSDCGLADAYVAQMKGVLATEGPTDLRLLDLSHELPRGDALAAARFVEAAVPTFPPNTIHLVVVDPGVGSARRVLIARLPAGQAVVAPDNGLLCLLNDALAGGKLTAVDTGALARRRGPGQVSATFHGRDLMAPIAARLARGMDASALGHAITDPVSLSLPVARRTANRTVGQVIHVDHFGNLITNVTARELPEVRDGQTRVAHVGVQAGGTQTEKMPTEKTQTVGPLRTHYAQAKPGELLLLWDSGGRLEVAQRDGSAVAKLQVDTHVEVTIEVVDVLEGEPKRGEPTD